MNGTQFTALLALLVQVAPGAGPLRETPGLKLRGAGCHVDLLASDGGLICKAIATTVPLCAPLTAFLPSPDGGMVAKRFRLGSNCSPPRLGSADLGNGGFFVEKDDVVFHVICDDASACQ